MRTSAELRTGHRAVHQHSAGTGRHDHTVVSRMDNGAVGDTAARPSSTMEHRVARAGHRRTDERGPFATAVTFPETAFAHYSVPQPTDVHS
jgi:hypothetical protein